MEGPACGGTTVHALVLAHRLSVDLADDAEVAMGHSPTAGLDIRVLWIVHQDGGVSSSSLVDQLALPRSTVARALARVRAEGLVRRASDPRDARRAQWRLTRLGRRRVDRYVAAAAGTVRRHRASVEQLLLAQGRIGGPPGGGAAAAVFDAVDALTSAQAVLLHEVVRTDPALGLAPAADRAALLAVADRGSARPGELADDTGLSPAGITSLLDRLGGHGLLVRHRRTDGDGRAVDVSLTPSGHRAVDALVEVSRRHEESLLDALAMTLAIGATAPDDAAVPPASVDGMLVR